MASVRYFPLDSEVNMALGEMEPFNFTYVYNFEKISFGLEATFLQFVQKNWHWTIYLSAVYVALVFYGHSRMKSRPRFELRRLLALWSAVLATFSIMGAYRSIPDLVHTWTNYSFHHSVCHPNYFYGVTGFWSICFVLSKVYELGDTAFIVLRKQPLMLLHWYHHVTVMVYVWHSYSEHASPGRWFFAMNYTVHAFMYSYYTLRALQYQPPRWASMAITSMQIAQMVVGCLLFAYVLWTKSAGLACQVSDANAVSGSLMYASYLALFAHFFWNAYLRPRRAPLAAGKPHQLSSSQQQQQPASNGGTSEVTAVLKSVADIERRGFVSKKDK